ncbi:ABC transporter ATP-binding protein [Labrys neptuniae]
MKQGAFFAKPRFALGVAAISTKAQNSVPAITLLRRIFSDEGSKHTRAYGVALAAGAVEAAMGGLVAWLIGPVIRAMGDKQSTGHIAGIALVVVAVFLIRGAASYAKDTVLARIGNSIIASVQQRLFNHVIQQDMVYFTARHSSEMVTANGFVANCARIASNLLVTSISNVLQVVALISVMVLRDPLLALSALVVMPPAVVGIRYITRRIKRVVTRQYQSGARIVGVLQETSQGIRVVKSFGMEEAMRRRMAAGVVEAEAAANKMARLGNRSGPIMETMAGFAVAAVIVYGGWRINTGQLTVDQLISFLFAFLTAYAPSKALARVNVDLNAAVTGVSMFYDILDEPAREGAVEQAKPAFVNKGGHIVFDHVNFGYKPDEPVLRDLCLVAEAGKTTALVGPSGGGKSTIVNLILRFYEPTTGAVEIDGQNIASTSVASVRDHMAYVGQDVFLFVGTIRENIAFGRPGAPQEAIEAAAKAAFAHDFITDFDQGYDTEVGERGLQLSGGQRARIAIARAILRDAAIILLDEATAALDSQSEQAVQNALDDLCAGRTVVVIAHRLQTIQEADKICVIDGGRLAEEGSHEGLLAKGGRYAALHAVQFREEPELSPV